MSTAEIEMSKDISFNQDEDFLDYALERGFGELHCKIDQETGMKAIVAIHSTKLGPALGGCRFISYPSTPAALYDAMRLARGMSYKAALVNLPLGGGKAVIMKPKEAFDRKGYFKAFGKFVESLNGNYITALDSGTTLEDMDIISESTSYLASMSAGNGDPSPHTAEGVLKGIQAAVLYQLDKENLEGIHVALQGLGHVGYSLAELLIAEGASLTVADINPELVQRVVSKFGAKAVDTKDIHKVKCDVYSPCALGAVINDTSIQELQATIIAGAANNQLSRRYHGQMLHDRGILYAADYVINAGGLIYAASRYFKTEEETVKRQINGIKTTLLEIFARSTEEDKSVSEVADRIAQEKLA